MLVEYSLYSRPRRVRREGEGKGREGTTYPVFLVLIDFTCHQFSEPPSWEEERREKKGTREKGNQNNNLSLLQRRRKARPDTFKIPDRGR